jgi:hypothetical protein
MSFYQNFDILQIFMPVQFLKTKRFCIKNILGIGNVSFFLSKFWYITEFYASTFFRGKNIFGIWNRNFFFVSLSLFLFFGLNEI